MTSLGETPFKFSPVNPSQHDDWMALCQDARWKYQPANEEEVLYYCKDWNWSGRQDEFSPNNKPVVEQALPEEDMIHPGSLAPKFVFETTAEPEPGNDDLQVYLRRLICFLCNRFVILSRPSEGESLQESQGMPRDGTRYWWRYWDNDKNVYEINFEKFRDSAGTFRMGFYAGEMPEYRNLKEETRSHGMPPGEFNPPKNSPSNLLWMRISKDITASGCEYTDRATFLDHMWSFRHHGTTLVPLWDANLMILAQSAGVPLPEKSCRGCSNHVEHALRRCARCKLVFYCQDGYCQRQDWHDHKKMCNYFK